MGFFDRFKGKPDPPNRDEIIADAYRQMDRYMRKASLATLGGERPTGDPLRSRFAGDLVMLPNEEWPMFKGRHLQAFLQINVAELPHVPEQLMGFRMITVFVEVEEMPFERPLGEGWVVRCYPSLDGLVSRSAPDTGSTIKSFEITWTASNDAPCGEDIPADVDLRAIHALKDSDSLMEERSKNYEYTKVGGWPNLIQSELEMGGSNFLFQVGSEDKANWNCIDGGTMYFGIVDGEWKFECQFY